MGQFMTHHHGGEYSEDEYDSDLGPDCEFEAATGEMIVESVSDISTLSCVRKVSVADSKEHFLKDQTIQHISDRHMPKHSCEVPTGRTLLLSINMSNRDNDIRKRRNTVVDAGQSQTSLASLSQKSNRWHVEMESRNHLGVKLNSMRHKRSNSCSTVFVDETISCPDLKRTLKYVAFALHSACQRCSGHNELYLHEAFDERKGPMLKTSRRPVITDTAPSASSVYKFLCKIFMQTSLTAEIVIVSTVYVERLVFKTGIDLHATNWRRIALGAIILASKVWDDEAVWNVDFMSLFPALNTADVNELERTFLELIEYNVGVKVSVFAKYYFDLRDMTESTHVPRPMKPLSWQSARRLEAVTIATERLLRIDESTKQLDRLKRGRSYDTFAHNCTVVLS
eukprot:CFRG6766T1